MHMSPTCISTDVLKKPKKCMGIFVGTGASSVCARGAGVWEPLRPLWGSKGKSPGGEPEDEVEAEAFS